MRWDFKLIGLTGSAVVHLFLVALLVLLSYKPAPVMTASASQPVMAQMLESPPPPPPQVRATPPPPEPRPVSTPEPVRPNEIIVPEKPKETPKPTPTPTPRPTATPTPRPTATPTPTPRPTATPTPTPRPTATPRATPTSTPRPTATPRPTPTPRQTPTPRPAIDPSKAQELYNQLNVPSTGRAPRETPRQVAQAGASRPAPRGAADTHNFTSKPVNVGATAMHGDGLPEYYSEGALRAVGRNFNVPAADKQNAIAIVEFTILRDGTLKDFRIVKSAGSSRLDKMALDALEATKRFSPLPDGVQGSSIRRRITFSYQDPS
jgi:TonB family protein